MSSPLTQNAPFPAQRIIVRFGYSDEAVWRPAMSPSDWLHSWSCDGSLDAREWVPSGSTLAHGRTSCEFRTT